MTEKVWVEVVLIIEDGKEQVPRQPGDVFEGNNLKGSCRFLLGNPVFLTFRALDACFLLTPLRISL